MFSLKSWTEPIRSQPYRITCETCRVSEGFDSERERWLWSQAHACPSGPPTVLYLDAKRQEHDARG